jgi:hypothetical protein
MKMSKEVRQESSIPIQTRVSFMSLAKLHVYWSLEGYNIKTMSQLAGWSVDLLCEVLEANGKMPAKIETLAEAHRYLQIHGLYQGSTKKRAMKKIGTALKFETMRGISEDPRLIGGDPKYEASTQYKMLHKKNSVEPLDCLVDSGAGGTSNEEWEMIQKRIKEEDEKDRVALVKASVKIAKDSGLVVSEPESEVEMFSQEDARARYFKALINIKSEYPGISGEDAKAKAQAKLKGETFTPESGPVVKEGMSEEEFMERAKERDLARTKLENAPFEASDLPIVSDEKDKEV